ncbi:MAG: DUF2064 domain-containing protein [Flavobacteriaceae bacterium]
MNKGQDLDTAILVFANSSEAELQNKSIAQGAELFEALSRQTLKVVAQSGLPYYLYTEKEQEGATFSERFTHAIQEVFEKGYKRIITVGNDSPHLRTEDLSFAHQQLLSEHTVLGPSADGGVYLMGIHKADFDKTKFQSLPWQTSNLYTSLAHFLSRCKKVIRLRTLFDLDTFEDLRRFTARFKDIGTRLLPLFIVLLRPKRSDDHHPVSSYALFLSTHFFNKGSPLSFMAV